MEIKFFVDIRDVPDDAVSGENYRQTMDAIRIAIHKLASQLGGRVADIEIK